MAEREPWMPYLCDRADGVRGHYAICRWHPSPTGGYREAWNLRSNRWASASDEVLTLAEAEKLLAKLTAEAFMDEPAQPGEVEHMRRLHRRATDGVPTPAPAIQPTDDEIRAVWNRTQDPIATVRAFGSAIQADQLYANLLRDQVIEECAVKCEGNKLLEPFIGPLFGVGFDFARESCASAIRSMRSVGGEGKT
jgi:hypothetical protein